MVVLHELTKGHIVGFADRRIEGDGALGGSVKILEAVDADVHSAGELAESGVSSKLLLHLTGDLHHSIDGFEGVDRDTDGASVVANGAGNSLTNPPGGVGAKSESSTWVVLLNRTNEAHVAFLDKVLDGEAATNVPFCDADNEAEV